MCASDSESVSWCLVAFMRQLQSQCLLIGDANLLGNVITLHELSCTCAQQVLRVCADV